MDTPQDSLRSSGGGWMRIADASGNRAAEGLRVVEDYLRFDLQDAFLVDACKALRHQLGSLLAQLPPTWTERSTLTDVGQQITTPTEHQRSSAGDTLRANLKRVQQAVRSLEEWTKVGGLALSADFERLRYRAYDLEGLIERTTRSRTRLHDIWLYVLIDGGRSDADFQRRVTLLVENDIQMIQLRVKSSHDRDLLHRAQLLRELTSSSQTLVIINDRPDIAALVDADGVHLGQDDLPIEAARRIIGGQRLVGRSTHSLAQMQQALAEGVDYLGVGPVFPSSTKSFDDFPGLDFVRQTSETTSCPAFAIGGIDADRLTIVRQHGLQRVAVSSAIWHADDIAVACRQFRHAHRTLAEASR